MLPKKYRLTKNKEFEKVWKTGKSHFEKELGIKAAKNDLESSRFGFVVSTKISKKAVVRNKVKRRLREIIRKHLPNIEPGYDFSFITRPGIERLEFQELETLVKTILKKLGLLRLSFPA